MANRVKILLVDDNPMVMGLLRGALAPLATVATATDATDALLKAIDDPPDLLVSDYRMPGMDGRQLVEKLRGRPATAGISVVMLAAKNDISDNLGQQEQIADDYVEKPFFLKDATRRIKRVIDKIALEKMAKTAPSDGVLRGSLSQMNVIDLLQSLEMGRKSCQLTLTNGSDRCEVLFCRRPGHACRLRRAKGRRGSISRCCAGPEEISSSTSKAKPSFRAPPSTPRACSWRVCAFSTRPTATKAEPRKKKMSSSTASPAIPETFTAAVLTVSDSRSQGDRKTFLVPPSSNASPGMDSRWWPRKSFPMISQEYRMPSLC